MALVFIMHLKVKWVRQRSKETEYWTKLVLQAMKVRAHNGVVTPNLLREMHLTHHILVLFSGPSWNCTKHWVWLRGWLLPSFQKGDKRCNHKHDYILHAVSFWLILHYPQTARAQTAEQVQDPRVHFALTPLKLIIFKIIFSPHEILCAIGR